MLWCSKKTVKKYINLKWCKMQFWNKTKNAAYTNKKINSERNHETYMYVFFSCRRGATYRNIDDLSICPSNINLYLIRLLVIPYSCQKRAITQFRDTLISKQYLFPKLWKFYLIFLYYWFWILEILKITVAALFMGKIVHNLRFMYN